MKTKSKTSGYIIRSGAAAAFFLFVIVALSPAFNKAPKSAPPNSLPRQSVKASNQARTLTFAERVAYQRAIEGVYWRHRIWPKENSKPKPSIDAVMSRAEIEKKVEDYLRNSKALEDYWQKPVTPDQLQAEMERVASHTKQPGVLREIFAALGNDPSVIAECLARPALSERLLTDLYAHDQRFHGDLKCRAEADLAALRSVKQMKQTSGMYSEIEWVKSDDDKRIVAQSRKHSELPNQKIAGQAHRLPKEDAAGGAPALQEQDAPNTLKLNSAEWNANVEKLADNFGLRSRPRGIAAFEGSPRRVRPVADDDMSTHSQNAAETYEAIPTEKLSPLQEDDGRYYATAVIKKNTNTLKLATVAWRKEPFESWRARAENQTPKVMAATMSASYTLPVISAEFENSTPSVACTDDIWTATSTTNAPSARAEHSAVWTGSEMIVWGGYDGSVLNTGGKYDPSTDTWTATSTANAPSARASHTAVWSGCEMIVWGGNDGSNRLNTGGRYNPAAPDATAWTSTSTTNAPSARGSHTAVWSRSEMIVWGGGDNSTVFNTGGRYNPSTNTWTATSTTNAPSARSLHTAVWSGNEMIIWGGGSNTGGRYNPSTNTWTATSTTNAPESRSLHTAVWTGSTMIVWGGVVEPPNLISGGQYNPSTDSWTPTSTTNAPEDRFDPTAVWTGSEMIVWGGDYCDGPCHFLNTGGRYNPTTDSWTATSTNAPSGRFLQTAVWSGSQMIVWGGVFYDVNNTPYYLNTGGRYCANTACPTPESAHYLESNFVPLDNRLSVRKLAPHSPQQGSAGGLTINLSYACDSTFNAAGLSSQDITDMKAACDYARLQIMSNFSDPIHVNILVTAIPGTCKKGGSSPGLTAINYTNLRNKLLMDSTTADDQTALGAGGSLPTSDPIMTSHLYALTRAQAKALDPVLDDLMPDGTFTFGGGWSWTYDPLNRAVPGKVDFIGVAMHEFTEIMGRIGLMGLVQNQNQLYSLMDLFSYVSAGTRGLTNGPNRSFSIDNGTNRLKAFNDASLNGGDLQDWAVGTNDCFNEQIDPGIKYDLTTVDLRVMDVIGYDPTHPAFFSGEVLLGNGVYYLQFPNGTPFGYYAYLSDPRFIYHFDMGYEYWFDANDGHSGIYFYDFMSNHFFYTSPGFPFPYLYDFTLNTVLYYYPDPNNPGHYTTNPRYFYNFATGQIITM